jgi:hypothetical protein
MERAMRSEASECKTGLAWALAVGFALLAVGFRVIPYYLDLGPYARWVWNLTPVGALGLYAGARLRSQAAYLVPLVVMLASDLLLIKPLADHGYSAFSWGRPIIYASFLLNVLIGRALRERSAPLWIGGSCLLTAGQFFVVSNFLVWAGGDGVMYAKDLSGLVQCYVMAIPFFGNTLAGDLLFSTLFFGLFAVLSLITERQKASQPA